jgi:hypothetical protein
VCESDTAVDWHASEGGAVRQQNCTHERFRSVLNLENACKPFVVPFDI